MFLKIIRILYSQIKESINFITTAYIRYTSINLNPHKTYEVWLKNLLSLSYYAHRTKVFELTQVHFMSAGDRNFS